MADTKPKYGPDNPHPFSTKKTELVWEGKYDEYGKRREVDIAGCAMPMQKIETIDEPASRLKPLGLFDSEKAHKDDFRNMLIWGDNKLVMASLLKDFKGKIDLIYIDPPFDVGADFTMNIPVGDGKETIDKDQSTLEMVAYRDMWGKGTDSYLHMMYERLVLMKELLSETGSIYVHCDYGVNHFLKNIMDDIFGQDNFQNEIIWLRTRAQHTDAKRFGNVHDTIYSYSKSANFFYRSQYVEHKKEYIERFNKVDKDERRYMLIPAHAAGTGPARIFEGKEIAPPAGRHWAYTQENIDKLISDGKIEYTSTGMPNVKQYLDESKGAVVQSLWNDIIPLNPEVG